MNNKTLKEREWVLSEATLDSLINLTLTRAVTEVPSHEEYFGLDETEITEEEWNPIVDDKNEERMLIALLLLLSSFYNTVKDKPPDLIIDQIPGVTENYRTQMSLLSDSEMNKLTQSYREKIIEEYGISSQASPFISLKYNLTNTFQNVKNSINAMLNQLRDDILVKAQTFRDTLRRARDFNVRSNFQRAIRRTRNFVRFNAQMVKQKVTRAVQRFVHGENMKYFWVPAGHNTCDWCWNLSRLPAKPMDEWPFDHPNGNCVLKPESDKTSQEFRDALERWPVTII